MRWIPHAIYTGAVAFVSLWPRVYVDTYVADSIQRKDSFIHALCFAGMTAVSLWAYGRREKPWSSRLRVWVACVVFGIVLEVLQAFVPGINRNGNLKDVLDNAWGAAFGVWLPVFLWPKHREQRDP